MPNFTSRYADIAAYAREHGMRAASREFGCTQTTVRHACDHQGVEPKKMHWNRAAEVVAWMEQRDASVMDAAQEFNLSPSTVYQYCRRVNYTPVRACHANMMQVLRLLIEGMTIANVCRELGVTRKFAARIARDARRARLLGETSVVMIKPQVTALRTINES